MFFISWPYLSKKCLFLQKEKEQVRDKTIILLLHLDEEDYDETYLLLCLNKEDDRAARQSAVLVAGRRPQEACR